MPNSTYLQRLVARVGTPPHDSRAQFAPPEAPPLPIFNPFAEAGAEDEEPVLPMTVEPPAAALRTPPPLPAPGEPGDLPPPAVVERVVHEFLEPPSPAPPSPVEIRPEAGDLPLQQPRFERETELPPQIEPVEREIVERETVQSVVYELLAPPESEMPARPDFPQAPQQPALELETRERVVYEFIEAEGPETRVVPVEPPAGPEAPPVAPVFETPAPQITIGDIVVEIVTRHETQGRAAPQPPPPAPRRIEAPAPRAGVPSKRGYGLGQM